MHGRPPWTPDQLRPVQERPPGPVRSGGVVGCTHRTPHRSVDDQQWVEGLSGTGASHERTCEALHEILLRAARREARQRSLGLRVAGPDLDDLACQAASDALLLIIGKVREFRGESLFTTWATRFVVFEVIAKLGQHVRRHRWHTSLPPELWEQIPAAQPSPDLEAEAHELARVVLRAVDSQLTVRQRAVLLGLVRGATPAAVAVELELNANAVHQMTFRARRRLRHHLIAQGYLTPSDSARGPDVARGENRERAPRRRGPASGTVIRAREVPPRVDDSAGRLRSGNRSLHPA